MATQIQKGLTHITWQHKYKLATQIKHGNTNENRQKNENRQTNTTF